MIKNLIDLVEKEEGIILGCSEKELIKHGFVPGTGIIIYKKIPGITCVHIRGAIISSRDKQYQSVLVETYVRKE